LVASKLNIEVKVWADAMEIATQTMNIAQIALQWVIMDMGHLLHTSSLRPERHHSRRLEGLPVMGNTSPLVGIGSLQIHNWRNHAITLTTRSLVNDGFRPIRWCATAETVVLAISA
jgi:hypothetical protein